MRTVMCNLRRIILIGIAAVFFAGCSSFTASLSRMKPPSKDLQAMAKTQAVLAMLRNQNKPLKNFKGIGTIKVWYQGKLKIDERVAWIGSEAVKLSIVVLISGYPAIKMASDGEWFYYYEAGDDQPFFKKLPASDASLKRLIWIPIKATDIINLLAGRVPLREHHAAFLHKEDSGSGYVLVLKRRWWGVTEKIFLDENQSRADKIEFFNRSGALIYRVRFDEMQAIKGYRVPARLSVSNDEGANFQLRVDRYWADVNVSPSMFVLNPPD